MRRSRSKDGYASRCKICERNERQRKKGWNQWILWKKELKGILKLSWKI
jgi:hypothetical protein